MTTAPPITSGMIAASTDLKTNSRISKRTGMAISSPSEAASSPALRSESMITGKPAMLT